MLEAQDRIAFEELLQRLRLGFLPGPVLLVVACGPSAIVQAVVIAAIVLASYGWIHLLLQRARSTIPRIQLGLRLVDCGVVGLALSIAYPLLDSVYYDAIYGFLVVAAAVTHGKRGVLATSLLSGVGVLASRLYLIAVWGVPFDIRHITDSVFFTFLFAINGLLVAFLMRWRESIRARSERLREATHEIGQSLDPEVVILQVVDAARHLLGTDGAHLITFDERDGQGTQRIVTGSGYVAGKSDADGGALQHDLLALVDERQGVVAIDDLDRATDVRDRLPASVVAEGARAILGVPVLARASLRGFLLVSNRKPTGFSPEQREMLTVLATHAGIAIENARLHRAAQERRAQLEAVLASITEGLIVLDAQDRVVYFNQRLEELWSVPSTEVLGRPMAEVLERLGARMPGFVQRYYETAAPSGSRDVTTWEYAFPGPPRRDLQVTSFPVWGSKGSYLGRGALVRDVTRERELDRMKDNLITTVSHELRTPLASILGFTELVLHRSYPPEQVRDFLETVHREAYHMKTLVDEFMDIERLRIGMVTGGGGAARLDTVARQVVERLRAQADGCRFVLSIPAELPLVGVDERQLDQVLTNLVENAVKYSPRGGEVRVEAALEDEASGSGGGERQASGGQRMVRLVVEDHGLGLPPGAAERIFEDFYRLDLPDRQQIRGTGLGLAIVRRIVEQHGGRVWAESAGLGTGSRFVVVLPVAADARVGIPAMVGTGPAAHPGGHQPGDPGVERVDSRGGGAL